MILPAIDTTSRSAGLPAGIPTSIAPLCVSKFIIPPLAKFESVTGSIRFAGSFVRGGMINFDTHSGAIEVGIPAGSPADLDVVSIAGKITNRLTSTRPVPGRYGRGSELSTSSGDGGVRVSIRSFKGPVVLLRKD